MILAVKLIIRVKLQLIGQQFFVLKTRSSLIHDRTNRVLENIRPKKKTRFSYCHTQTC